MFLAERAVMHGIRMGLKAEPEFDPSGKHQIGENEN
jgi:hypothetical protein